MFAGLGMYCIGGFAIGAILAIPIAIMVIRVQREKERLEREAEKRRKEEQLRQLADWTVTALGAPRLPLTKVEE